MTTTEQPPLVMPFSRPSVLQVSPLFDQLRGDHPIVRVTTAAGDPAWLVLSYDECKQVYSDRRFAYFSHPDPENAPRLSEALVHSAPMGNVDFEAETTRLRKLMAPSFTPRRIKLLNEWIQQLTDQCLDDMEAAHDADPGAPVDFHKFVGYRLPVLVICALLGVPEPDRDRVLALSDRMGSFYGGMDAFAAMQELEAYMGELLPGKKETPGEDLLSDLVRANEEDPTFFSTRPLPAYAAGLVFPGHETTVVRMDFGLLYLLTNPAQRDWLVDDIDERVGPTVEEVLRLTSAHDYGLIRWASEDIEIAGVTIGAGELVIIDDAAANRDPAVFDDPQAFNPQREKNPHIAFGHGAHVCLGQSLARTELRAVVASTFRRFPGIRLAVDVNDLSIDESRVGGGVHELLVTW
ncbi:MAG TPA: cytochrome P450 [Acidimicrobiales bacterium]